MQIWDKNELGRLPGCIRTIKPIKNAGRFARVKNDFSWEDSVRDPNHVTVLIYHTLTQSTVMQY
jgi:hypothetical protein